MGIVENFNDYRTRMNTKIMSSESLIIKRIFNLDTNAYAEGALDEQIGGEPGADADDRGQAGARAQDEPAEHRAFRRLAVRQLLPLPAGQDL